MNALKNEMKFIKKKFCALFYSGKYKVLYNKTTMGF